VFVYSEALPPDAQLGLLVSTAVERPCEGAAGLSRQFARSASPINL
jgi:hypothetical protein